MTEKTEKIVRGGVIRLLWTGGWDSTFRLVELSRENVTIQPVYIYGDGRPSSAYEKRARTNILETLKSDHRTKAKILPVDEVDVKSIPQNKAITDAYNRIVKTHKLGSQYEWIARYAAQYPGCELCSERRHPNGIGYMSQLIESTGAIVETNDIHNYKVVSNSEDVMLLLGNVYFPIKDKMEIDMVNLIKQWGYEDVMKNIWFCFTPLKGKPCGFCRPCAEKMESDMAFLLPPSARRNYKWNQKYKGNKLFGLYYRIQFKFFRD